MRDEEGREYFLEKVVKLQNRYVKLDNDQVRLAFGLTLDVAREDEEAFWVKIYRVPDPVSRQRPSQGLPAVAAEPADDEEVVEVVHGEVTLGAGVGTSSRLRFEDYSEGLPESGQWRNGFVLVDWNGDGHLDLVHGPARKGAAHPWVFLGDGAGRWQAAAGLVMPRLRLDYGDVAVADFDGDGRLDLAFAIHLRGMVVLVARDGGRFETWSEGLEFSTPEAGQGAASFSSRALEVVDWNSDGRPDLLALGEGPRMVRDQGSTSPGFDTGSRGPALFLNRGDGTWERRDQGQSASRALPSGDALAVGDVDGDGRADFVTGSTTPGQTQLLFLAQADGGWKQSEIQGMPAGLLVKSLALADLDGDRRLDMVVGYLEDEQGRGWRTGVDVLFNDGKKGWTRQHLAGFHGRAGVTANAVGDLDGDGKSDVVAGTGSGDIWVFLGNGRRGFSRDTAEGLSLSDRLCGAYSAAVRDLDGQAGAEVLMSFAGEPGTEVMIPGLERRCQSGGALRGWRVVRQ